MSEQPYVQIEDKHGAVAAVYVRPDDQHEVYYTDNVGQKFYTEIFDHVPIEFVEQSVMDWAKGRRDLQ